MRLLVEFNENMQVAKQKINKNNTRNISVSEILARYSELKIEMALY
tara:strand:+ start:402 stop:539 length:138 start_codon:yes stop_codon:yes gene_type:complete